MPVSIPDNYLDLCEKATFAILITLMPDNQPQASPIWWSYDGTHLLINTEQDTQKDRNLRRSPQVTVIVVDPTNPYRYLEVRGRVYERTEAGAIDHIDQLALKYTGKTPYYGNSVPVEQQFREIRILYRIQPEKVIARTL